MEEVEETVLPPIIYSCSYKASGTTAAGLSVVMKRAARVRNYFLQTLNQNWFNFEPAQTIHLRESWNVRP